MATFIFSNNCETTLAAPITTVGQTTIVLASSANIPSIPAGDYWVLTLNDALTGNVYEIVWVTGAVGATLTVLRGQEGTAANTWLVGDDAYATDTAATLNNFVTLSPNAQQSGSINISGSISGGAITATTITASGVIESSVGIQDTGASPTYTLLHGNVPLFGVPSTNMANLNTISFGQSAGTTTIGTGSTNFSSNNGVSATTFAMSSGSLNSLTMDSNGAIGLGVVAAGHGNSNTLYGVVGISGSAYLAGSAGNITKALDFGNGDAAGHYTRLGSMADTVQTIVGTVAELADSAAGALVTVDISGDIGILGTLHQSSSRERKQRIKYVEPAMALEVVLRTRIARYDFIEESPLDNGQARHASFIADETPWELSGGPGYEHADPQKTASYALAAIAALHDRIMVLEGKYPTA